MNKNSQPLVFALLTTVGLPLVGCQHDSSGEADTFSTAPASSDSTDVATGEEGETSKPPSDTDADSGIEGSGDGPLLDVGPDESGGDGDLCSVAPDGGIDAAPDCDEQAPARSFAPVLQWSFTPDDGYIHSTTIPLVANMTDDDNNGVIDLCDVPDVVLTGWQALEPQGYWTARIYVLDGATGSLHYKIEDPLATSFTPALGDIDNDGVVELVTARTLGTSFAITAYENDGSLKWESAAAGTPGSIISLADLDADGDVEIVAGRTVLDHNGDLVWTDAGWNSYSTASVPVDLDGDGLLEVVHPDRVYRADGTTYATLFDGLSQGDAGLAVVDFDNDGFPDILRISGHFGVCLWSRRFAEGEL